MPLTALFEKMLHQNYIRKIDHSLSHCNNWLFTIFSQNPIVRNPKPTFNIEGIPLLNWTFLDLYEGACHYDVMEAKHG